MPGKPVIPPPSTIRRELCTHRRAGEKTTKCPDCQGFMRRCCQSVLGEKHAEDCT